MARSLASGSRLTIGGNGLACLLFLATVGGAASAAISFSGPYPSPADEASKWADFLGRAVSYVGDKDKTCRGENRVIFYEGNGCTQNTVGSYGWRYFSSTGCPVSNVKKWSCFDNDEARSLMILPGLPPGSVIFVCDDSDDCDDDSWTTISVRNNIPNNVAVCVNTFEESYKDYYVDVKVRRGGNLDGKVSRVGVCWRQPSGKRKLLGQDDELMSPAGPPREIDDADGYAAYGKNKP